MSQVGLQTLRDTFGKARMHATSPARVGGELGVEDLDAPELISRNAIPGFPA
jgi:hypothetical protein